jgi:predicted molibdopterin-dependent oxidoreductase YjgC
MGVLPDVYTGYQKAFMPAVREKFEKAWDVEKLPDSEGTKIPAMFDGIHHGDIRALYLIGENVVMSEPNQAHTVEALKKIEFLVVQDIFMNETAEFADVVLPATCYAETEGTFTNTERRVQRVRKSVNPPGMARDDWWIVGELSKRMGYAMNYTSSEQIWNEIQTVTPSMAGIAYRRIEHKGIQWPCPDHEHSGTCFLYCNNVFPCGKAQFKPAEWKPAAECADAEYPLVLTTGRRLWQYHTGTQTRKSRGFNELCPEELIEVNPADAAKLGVENGEYVFAVSRRGRVKVKTWVTDRVQEGVCFMTFHFSEACANVITNNAFDPVAGTAEYKACAIRLEKA